MKWLFNQIRESNWRETRPVPSESRLYKVNRLHPIDALQPNISKEQGILRGKIPKKSKNQKYVSNGILDPDKLPPHPSPPPNDPKLRKIHGALPTRLSILSSPSRPLPRPPPPTSHRRRPRQAQHIRRGQARAEGQAGCRSSETTGRGGGAGRCGFGGGEDGG